MRLAALLALALLPTQDLRVVGARVLSPAGDRWLEGVEVVVREGRVAEVGPAAEPLAALPVLDGSGGWLVPGLIDLHSHVCLHAYDETPWNDQVLRESLELRTIRAVAHAQRTLEAGFTTLRDLGTEGAGFADVALRDAIAAGLVPGPRLFATTRAIVATGCYGPAGFDPRWDVPKGAQEADGIDGVRVAVRQQVAAGADWIKVYADYRRRPGAGATPTFSRAELEALVAEATSAGLPVAAHASTDEGARRAVLAGVRTIEHGTDVSSDTFALMRERGVALCPTLAAAEAIARQAGWSPPEPEPARVREARAMLARALAAGVTIVNGSDVGVFAHGENARELELLVEYGMSPADALRAATAGAAAVLGRAGELGVIAPGAHADLVLLGADPLASPTAVRAVRAVVRAGSVVARSR